MNTPFYITTAIAYANAKPHIGYALECVYADVLARYWRQQGRSVWFLTGTDEHGQKIVQAAKKNGQPPKTFLDETVLRFKALRELLNLTTDVFARTTDVAHYQGAQVFWERCMRSGDIYKKNFQGLYCVGCEAFKTEKELVDGKCPDHKVAPELIEEENYFFKLSAYTDKILDLYTRQPHFVYPDSKFNEMKSLLKEEGLQDISISRSRNKLAWGVPVPNDPEQVMYVWFDALTVYLTGIGFGQGSEWEKWWPATVQVIGKEINRFHSALWPAMLMSAGLPLPQQIAVHGWITVDGQKMSKTVGNVLDPVELVEQYGQEPIRYYLLREIPFERDGDFSHRRFAERYTADLANDLGNLLSRSTNMIEKFLAGKVDRKIVIPKELVKLDSVAQTELVKKEIEGFHFDQALEHLWQVFREGNGLIDREKPWELAKTNPVRLEQVLTQLVLYLECAADGLVPLLPKTASTIQKILSADRIIKAEPLFPRLIDKQPQP